MPICICLYLRMTKWRCALPQKNLSEGISAYAYLFMSSFFGGGGEKWDMKDEKINDMREGLGGVATQKPQHFDARKGNRNHICDPTYGFIN